MKPKVKAYGEGETMPQLLLNYQNVYYNLIIYYKFEIE